MADTDAGAEQYRNRRDEKIQRATVPLLLLLLTSIIFATHSTVSADCKYKFGVTQECAPIQSLSIDRIDFEIVADEITHSDGTVYPACAGRLYIEGGNVVQFTELDQAIGVTFGKPRYASDFAPRSRHDMMPSTLRPGALEKVDWIAVYRYGSFEYPYSYKSLDFQPNSRGWWVPFNEDHQTIPVSLGYSRTYDSN